MQNDVSSFNDLKILVVMPETNARLELMQNIQQLGFQADILTTLPAILKKLNHTERYELMFISIEPEVANGELISFLRSGIAGKSPYLVGISAKLSELQKNIYPRFGGVHECIKSENNFLQLSKVIQKVHQKKGHQKTPTIPIIQQKLATV